MRVLGTIRPLYGGNPAHIPFWTFFFERGNEEILLMKKNIVHQEQIATQRESRIPKGLMGN